MVDGTKRKQRGKKTRRQKTEKNILRKVYLVVQIPNILVQISREKL